MEKVLASIITIGDELLIGQVVDTNSAWIARELNAIGVWVHRRVAVGDDRDAIRVALDAERRVSALVLITGGLGPTADDITKPVLCGYFGGKLVLDQPTLDHVTYLFEKVFKRPGPLLERNRKQAEVPDVCTVLHNRIGTAPGMLFDRQGVPVVSMPGVPLEMMGLMRDEVLPWIKSRFTLPEILHRTVLTIGLGESTIAERLAGFEEDLPGYIKLAYLPHYGMVRLRLTSTGGDSAELDNLFDRLCSFVDDVTVAREDITMEEVVGRLLLEQGQTVATAESCTGGAIASALTSIPGSSRWYRGSVVSYANSVKEGLLGIPQAVIDSEGAVSDPVVTGMAKGLLDRVSADYAVATSGIMGPDGGTERDPVGSVWIAAGNRERVVAKRLHFRYDRKNNISLTTINALNILRLFILEAQKQGNQ